MDADRLDERQLNPFVFPSETNVRFTLLMLAALMLTCSVGVTINLYTDLVETLPDSLSDIDFRDTASVEQWLVESNQRLMPVVTMGLLTSSPPLIVFFVALIIYLTHPYRIRRKKRLRLMTSAENPPFFEAVQALVRLSGVSPAPTIELDTGSRSPGGQVFGLHKRYILGLGGQLRLLLYKRPDDFRAIVLHELAHIANGDIGRTYFAEAVWLAAATITFVITLTFIGFNFGQGLIEQLAGGLTGAEWTRLLTVNLPAMLIILFQFGASIAIIAAIYSSLLRVREVYADWRAALWGVATPLADILRRNISSHNKNKRRWFVWGFHPSPQDRLTLLQNPNGLFQVTTELSFFTGILLAYIIMGAIWLMIFSTLIGIAGSVYIQQILFPRIEFLLIVFAVTIVVISVTILAGLFGLVYLIGGTLGLEVQRQTMAGLVTGEQRWVTSLKLWKPALLMAAGFQLGLLLTPLSMVSLPLFPDQILTSKGGSLISLANITLLTIVSTTCLSWLWLLYTHFFARHTLGCHRGASSPHRARRWLTLVSSGALLVLFLPVFIAYLTNLMAIANQTQSNEYSVLPGLDLLLVMVAIALFGYVITFGVTWLFVQLRHLIGRPHCPACRKLTHQRYAVGQQCEHCGQTLAAWVFVK